MNASRTHMLDTVFIQRFLFLRFCTAADQVSIKKSDWFLQHHVGALGSHDVILNDDRDLNWFLSRVHHVIRLTVSRTTHTDF